MSQSASCNTLPLPRRLLLPNLSPSEVSPSSLHLAPEQRKTTEFKQKQETFSTVFLGTPTALSISRFLELNAQNRSYLPASYSSAWNSDISISCQAAAPFRPSSDHSLGIQYQRQPYKIVISTVIKFSIVTLLHTVSANAQYVNRRRRKRCFQRIIIFPQASHKCPSSKPGDGADGNSEHGNTKTTKRNYASGPSKHFTATKLN
jgi:hypothetical protein